MDGASQAAMDGEKRPLNGIWDPMPTSYDSFKIRDAYRGVRDAQFKCGGVQALRAPRSASRAPFAFANSHAYQRSIPSPDSQESSMISMPG